MSKLDGERTLMKFELSMLGGNTGDQKITVNTSGGFVQLYTVEEHSLGTQRVVKVIMDATEAAALGEILQTISRSIQGDSRD